MSWNLHIGKVYQIEYGYPGMCGSDSQEALYDIFKIFEIKTTAEDCYDEEYEVERKELCRLRSIIIENDKVFKNRRQNSAMHYPRQNWIKTSSSKSWIT